jgi:protein TonB
MTLRVATSLLSFALHGAVVAFIVATPGSASLESGSGTDLLEVERGLAIEGIARLGQDETTVEAVEAPPEVSEARPEIEEAKPVEEEEHRVIASESGPEQETIAKEPEVLETPRPPQLATIEQREIAVEEQLAAGAKQSAGSASIISAYRGKLYQHLTRKKVNPRSLREGTVVVRFTVDASGQVLSREVAESSGYKMLDDAAVASIDRAAPFPPMPDEIASAPMVLSVPFKFTVR